MEKPSHLTRCPRCGAYVPADASDGLCPACLIAIAEAPTVGEPREARTEVPATTGSRDMVQESTRPTPGQVFGPYHIERLIGHGGMGEVYEAEHVEQGRGVALKVLHQRLSGREDHARFVREGQLAASINHPHTVYIFGSEEINGIPTIAMELLPGGTLKDRVKERGPLPPAAAVDAILQVIAGLDAMHAVGVLHRDVKPSNCFVDADGTVKVGDFGLSISTLAREVSQLTMSGAFLGTPQFAAPEQLRGDPLDLRADIYGVGATLYFLLTGQPPLDDTNVLALVTRIATEAPRSPRALVPSLPRGLAAIILRCLARDRAQRPASYAALSDALRPFSSAAATPATMGLRFVAWIIDSSIVIIPLNMLNVGVFSPYVGSPTLVHLLTDATLIAYYAILEGLWRASIGKRLVGLRVVLASGGRAVGVSRAAGRTLIVETPNFVLLAIVFVVGEVRMAQFAVESPLWAAPLSSVGVVLLALLFSTARRRNGFAAVHDLWTGTRVVQRVKEVRRPVLVPATEPAFSATAPPQRVGPFDVISTLGRTDVGSLSLGFDPRLRRRVWLHELPVSTPKVAPLVRDLNRPGRLRWLGGRRTSTASWDAYEALDGGSLVTVLNRPQPWSTVRAWLTDLALEIGSALKDGSLGRLSLDQVWITCDGRAKLLDFRAPGAPSTSALVSSVPVKSAQAFLSHVATCALSGRPRAMSEIDRGLRHTLPLSAWALLNALDRQQLENWSEVADDTSALMKGADRIERGPRAATLTLCAALPLVMVLLSVTGNSMSRYTMGDRYTEFEELSSVLSELTRNTDRAFDRDAAETYIAARFESTLTDPQLWTNPHAVQLLIGHRRLIERIAADHPRVSPEEMAAATAALGPFLERQASMRRFRQSRSAWATAWLSFARMFLMTAVFGVGTAWLFRGGLFLRAFGIEVVTNIGVPASRLRTLWRGLLAWSPVIIALGLLALNPILLPVRDAREVTFVIGVCAAAIFVVGAMWAVMHPERGLQDRVAGTYLVPR